MGSETHAAAAVDKLENLSISILKSGDGTSNDVGLVPCTPPANQRSPCSLRGPQTPEILICSGLETPTHTLFDSFAPGPDKLMLAPQHPRNHRLELRIHVVRRLNFTDLLESKTEETTGCIECFLEEIINRTLLDAIVSEQQVEAATPKSAPRLTGNAETCPPAPLKSIRKSRRIIDKDSDLISWKDY